MGIARSPDASAVEALFRAHAPELRRYLRRLCRDSDLAEDLLQETFRKAQVALPRLADGVPRRAWLYAIATNLVRSAARTAYWRRVRPLGDGELERAGDDPPEVRAAALDLIERALAALKPDDAALDLIERALAALKPDDAALVLLHWRAGFGLDELCQATGLSRDALKKRLYRAKKAFSAAYARECARAEGGDP